MDYKSSVEGKEISIIVPEGYKVKIIKKGRSESLKRAQKAYDEKNKEKRREQKRLRNLERYKTDKEYREKTQKRMRETFKNKKLMSELPINLVE